MKCCRILYALLILSVLFLYTCSDDDNIVNPDDNFKELIKVTIGVAGGVISTDEIIVTIPEGAISTSTEIVLSESSDMKPFDEETIGRVYELSGLPEMLNQAIEIVLKVDVASLDDTEIALGTYIDAKSSIEPILDFITYDTEISSGELKTILQPTINTFTRYKDDQIDNNNSNKIYVTATKKRQKIIGEKFIVRFPRSDDEIYAEIIHQMFIDTYIDFEDVFNFDMKKIKSFPIEVHLQKMGYHGLFASGISGKPYFAVHIDSIRNNVYGCNPTIAHEFLHLIQKTYYNFRNDGKDDEWFDEASASYIEKFFQDKDFGYNSEYIPSLTISNGIAVFLGINQGWSKLPKTDSESTLSSQGYANASVLEYLMQKYTNNDTEAKQKLKIMIEGLSNKTSLFDIIKNEFEDINKCLPDLYKNILENKLYGGNSTLGNIAKTSPDREHEIINSDGQTFSYKQFVNPLSCTSFKIYPVSIDTAATIKIDVISEQLENTYILLYSTVSNQVVLQKKATEQLVINDVLKVSKKINTGKNGNFLVFIVNAFQKDASQGNCEMEFKITVDTEKKDNQDFNYTWSYQEAWGWPNKSFDYSIEGSVEVFDDASIESIADKGQGLVQIELNDNGTSYRIFYMITFNLHKTVFDTTYISGEREVYTYDNNVIFQTITNDSDEAVISENNIIEYTNKLSWTKNIKTNCWIPYNLKKYDKNGNLTDEKDDYSYYNLTELFITY